MISAVYPLSTFVGIAVGAKQPERGAKALGAGIAADEMPDFAPLPESPLPFTLYLDVDRTGVPTRTRRVGRRCARRAKSDKLKFCDGLSLATAVSI